MSRRCYENGRQPQMSRQLRNLSDSECQNESLTQTENKKEICRNFIWGTCNKNTLCKFRHEFDYEEMKKVLKFCHDYQNPPGCTREHCTYLHTTKEEENLFYVTGQLPRVLAERHVNMTATAAETTETAVETADETQVALHIQVSLMGQPPPPPPPAALVSTPSLSAPLPAAAPVTQQILNMLPIQQLLPPPPPPTVPSTVATSEPRGLVFTAPSSQYNTLYVDAQPPPRVHHRFDASCPPPPIPAHTQIKNGSLKRTSSNDSDALPSKIKKTKEGDAVSHCERCMQREIRVESLRDKIERLERDEEQEALAFKQMLLQYQNRGDLLRSIVNQDLYHLIDKYIENSVSNLEVHDAMAQFNQSSKVLPGLSAVPKQFLMQIFDYIFGGSSFESGPSSTMRLEKMLTAPLRTSTAPKSDVLQTLLEILKQSKAPEQGSASDFAPDILNQASHSSNTNGSHQLTNGMNLNLPMQTALPPTYQYAGAASVPPAPAPPAAAPAMAYFRPPYPHTSRVSLPPPSAPMPACPSYHAGLPTYAPGFYRQQQ